MLFRYKFYLALENSRCKDYVTEKFWGNGLGSYTVPVVLGPPREDYELFAPPNSFIHVDDFNSVKELADYLNLLHRNDKMYAKYIQWWESDEKRQSKKNSEPKSLRRNFDYGNGICGLCNKLKNEPNSERNVIENLDQWWFGKGYSPTKDRLPICDPNSGPSGDPKRWAVTLGYLVAYVLLIASSTFCIRRCILPKRGLHEVTPR